MPSTYTPSLRLEKPANGDYFATWDAYIDRMMNLVDDGISGATTVTATGGTYTLTSLNGQTDEARRAIITITSALSSNLLIVVPNVSKLYWVINRATGPYSVSINVSGGGTVVCPGNAIMPIITDGLGVIQPAGASIDGGNFIGPSFLPYATIVARGAVQLAQAADLTAGTSPTLVPPVDALVSFINSQIAAATAAVAIPSGSTTVWLQTAAPTGWTKVTSHNDKALRIVSGTAGSGGTAAFSATFSARTIARANLPNDTVTTGVESTPHNHSMPSTGDAGVSGTTGGGGIAQTASGKTTGNPSVQHVHNFLLNGGVTQTAMDFAVAYVDAIIASKN